MNLIVFFRALFGRAPAIHDDSLRAGTFRRPPIFTPWTMMVS
jgi:hypothetical protein